MWKFSCRQRINLGNTQKQKEDVLFSLDLFYLDNEIILRGQVNLPEYIISEHKNICYADDTVLVPDPERKLKEFLDKVVMGSKKKKQVVNCKNKMQGGE